MPGRTGTAGTLRAGLAVGALALLAGCAGFIDSRALPTLQVADRSLEGEEQVVVDGRRFTLRRYAETRAGMGRVPAFYVLGPDADREPRVLANGVELWHGLVNGQPFLTNFPGEWYCGQSRIACVEALTPERIPPQFGLDL